MNLKKSKLKPNKVRKHRACIFICKLAFYFLIFLWYTFLMILQVNKIFPLLDIQHGMTILDMGSSVGFWARQAVDSVGPSGKVVAVDFHENTIQRLNRDAAELGRENLHGMTGDVLNLQNVHLKKGSFDRVLFIRMIPIIEHEMDRVISELVEFTNSQGTLIIIDAMHYQKELESFLNNHKDTLQYSFINEAAERSDNYFFGVQVSRTVQ